MKSERNRSITSGITSQHRRKKGRPLIYLMILIILIVAMVLINNIEPKSGQKRDGKGSTSVESSRDPFIKEGELKFFTADSTQLVGIDIEIADDDPQREKGLMYRRFMDPLKVMLFIFEEEEERSFWMKNTYIALDILYLDGEKKILTIRDNTLPESTASIPSDLPAKYVVEVNAGFCAQYAILPGGYITFHRTYE